MSMNLICKYSYTIGERKLVWRDRTENVILCRGGAATTMGMVATMACHHVVRIFLRNASLKPIFSVTPYGTPFVF